MTKTKAFSLPSETSLAAALASFVAAVPAAQASVNVQQYSPAANSTYTMTEDALLEVAPKDPTWTGSRLFFSANYNWVNDPFVQYNEDRTVRTATLVDGIQTLDLGVGWVMARNFSLNFATAMDLVHLPSQANQFAFGDSRAFAKWRLTGVDSIVAISLIPTLWLPTGSTSLFLSDGAVGYGGMLAFEHDFGPVRAAANIGYHYSPGAQIGDLDYTQRMPMALGVFVPAGQHWGFNAEASGALVLPVNAYNNPNEVYFGTRYQFNRDCSVMAGLSVGSLNSQAGNDVRLSAGIRFSPMLQVRAPQNRPALAPPMAKTPPPAPFIKPAPRVVFTPKAITITEEIKFLHASAILTASGRNLLDEVADVMKKNRRSFKKIVIEGHTNELGGYPYNQKLSEQRAASVREYLGSRGVNIKDLLVIGYGKTRPKKDLTGLSAGARLAANRRVEFKVVN